MMNVPEGGNNLVFVATPIERMLLPEFLQSRAKCIEHLREKGMYGGQGEMPGSRVDNNRNQLVEAFLKHPEKAEWLWMLDDDMTYPPEAGERLAAWRVPVVVPLYFMSGSPYDPLVYYEGEVEDDKWGRPVHMFETRRQEVYDFLRDYQVLNLNDPMAIEDPSPEVLHPIQGSGCGGMMIHRSVVEQLDGPWFEYTQTGGEDFFFCRRVRHELGLEIYGDYSTICGHMEFNTHGVKDFLDFMQMRGYYLTRYNLEHSVRWMEKYLGISQEAAFNELSSYHPRLLDKYWFEQPRETPEAVQAFYKDPRVGRAYIIDLLRWNNTLLFNTIAKFLIPFEGARVFEIGSGIGTLAIQMAWQQCDVYAFEMNDVLRDFTAWRWHWYTHDTSQHIRVGKILLTDEWPTEADGPFDLVIATDVFEHVHKDELPGMLKSIGQLMPKRGRLYFHNAFSTQDGVFPYHFEHSQKFWEKCLKDAGFFLWDPERWAIKIRDPRRGYATKKS